MVDTQPGSQHFDDFNQQYVNKFYVSLLSLQVNNMKHDIGFFNILVEVFAITI